MTARLLVFYLLAALTVGSASLVVTRRNPVHSALFLVLAFMGVAGIYIVLEAEFLAAVQVLVYAGGVMVLFLFVIMLVDLEERGRPERPGRKMSAGTIAVGGGLTSVLALTLLTSFFRQTFSAPPATAALLRAPGGDRRSAALAMCRVSLAPFAP